MVEGLGKYIHYDYFLYIVDCYVHLGCYAHNVTVTQLSDLIPVPIVLQDEYSSPQCVENNNRSINKYTMIFFCPGYNTKLDLMVRL